MMFRTVKYRFLLIWILLGSNAGLVSAQTPFNEKFREAASGIHERIQLFTDRSIYAVDETIHFVAIRTISGLVPEDPWSKVLYVELIAPDGQPLVQGKYPLLNGRAEGSIPVSSESLTGSYYLKAYTRWMRNEGPQSFSFTALKLINPYRAELAPSEDEVKGSVPLLKPAFKKGILECTSTSASYRSGQEVILQMKGNSTLFLDQIRCCVTVAQVGAIDLHGGFQIATSQDEHRPFSVNFLPELGSGVSISGTVVDKDQQAVPNATLHFSMLGGSPDFFATYSDEKGRFILSTPPGSGKILEFFVTPEQGQSSALEVRIDQEFDSRTVKLPAEPFILSKAERELARKIALNMQLSKAFHTRMSSAENLPVEVYPPGQLIPFYGTGVKKLLIDDYVRLPNLEEVFINLVPELQFYKKRGETRIRFISENKSIGIYDPLVMIDNISVFDDEALLALSPEKIERIDMINDIYLKGNVAFGGLLAIHSRKGDMAGIDLPEGGYFFDYQSYDANVDAVISAPVQEGRVPDTRNTFLWEGDLQLDMDIQKELHFVAPATAGEYEVLLRGILPDGELFSTSTIITVE